MSVPGGVTGESSQQTPPNNAGGNGGEQTPANPAAQDGDGTGAGKPGAGEQQQTQEKTFTQAEVNQLIDDRLKRERDKNEREAADAKAKAEQATLAEQSKFKELSESLRTELDGKSATITDLEERLGKAEKALSSILETQRKDVPPHIIKLLDRMTPAEQLEYIAENAADLKPAAPNGSSTDQQRTQQQAHVPATPNPGGAPLSDEERRKQAAPARSMW